MIKKAEKHVNFSSIESRVSQRVEEIRSEKYLHLNYALKFLVEFGKGRDFLSMLKSSAATTRSRRLISLVLWVTCSPGW